MSSLKRMRNNYSLLEGRRLLAGNVTVFDGAHLYIRGDAANNQFEVVVHENELRINGLDGTTINRKDSYVVESATVTDNGVVFNGGLRAHLGPGHDDFTIRDAVFDSMSIVYGGTGNDRIDIVDSVFGDKVTLQTYDGDDLISTTGSRFTDDFFAITLDGKDTVSMVDTVLDGDSFVVTGNHADSVRSEDNHYAGELNLILPFSGDDSVQLINPVVGEGKLGLYLGEGDDALHGDLSGASIGGLVEVGGQDGMDESWQMPMSDEISSSVSMSVDSQLVYDNGAGGISGVTFANATSFFNSPADNYHWATELQLESNETINRISWTGSYSSFQAGGNVLGQAFAQDDFTIEIYEGSTYSPVGDAIVAFNVGDDVNRTDTGVAIPLPSGESYPVFAYSADIDVTLEAGKIYWVSIFSATEADIPAGDRGFNYNNFNWADGTIVTEALSSSAYTFGTGYGNSGDNWYNDFGPGVGAKDFQLWRVGS